MENTDYDFTVRKPDVDKNNVNQQETKSNVQNSSIDNQTVVFPQIPNDSVPFIVLCGPPSSGKSMVLKSLASYLYSLGMNYSISANKTLLNSSEYEQDCDMFDRVVGDPNKPFDNTVNYLMADIFDEFGNVKAHFLEAPGEDFFSLIDSEREPNLPFKGYMDKLAQSITGNRKVIYIILLDLDSPISFRRNNDLRVKYESKMVRLYNTYVRHHPSRVVLLYNKVDLPQNGLWANSNGCSNPKAVFKDAKLNYPNLFFRKRFLFWNIENYSFLPYCTGSYPDGGYTACGPTYPSMLWKEIMKIW